MGENKNMTLLTAKEAKNKATNDILSLRQTIARKIEDACNLHKLECDVYFEGDTLYTFICKELVDLGYKVEHFEAGLRHHLVISWR
jgi:hypothetical protein